MLTQFLSGHNYLLKHRNTQNNVQDPFSCRFCKENEEEAFHLIGNCPALSRLRTEIFGTFENLPMHPEWKIDQIENFLKKSKIDKILEKSN